MTNKEEDLKTVQLKINQIIDLNRDIERNLEFLWLLKKNRTHYRSGEDYTEEDKEKINNLTKLQIQGDIWTGSQNPTYSQSTTDSDLIWELKESMVEITERYISRQKQKLSRLIN